jgi:hypothetical protein
MSFQPLPNPPTSVVVPEMVPRGTAKAVFNPAADNFAQSLNPFSLYLQDFRAWVQNANQIMYANLDGVYDDTVIAKNAAVQSATTATSQAGIATTKANEASASAATAVQSATTATAQAGIATTKAGEASASAATATTQAGITATKAGEASTKAATATTQAGIATTKANEALASETSARNSATTASWSSAIAVAQADRAEQDADRAEVFAGEVQSAATIALNTVSSLTPRLGLNVGNWKIEDGELIVSHLTTATPTIVQGDFILTYEEIEDFA